MMNYNVYNYYGMTYLPKTNTKYDTHKSNELKNIYKSMVSHNKQSPLYKFSMSQETQDYALSIKDAAIDLKNISSFLSDDTDTVFNKKIFATSDEDVLDVRLNTDDYSNVPEKMDIEVSQLASSQVNRGQYVNSKNKGLSTGNYNVNLTTPQNDYLFSLKVTSSTRNIDAQQSLADAINLNLTGVRARVDVQGNESALILESQFTGEGTVADNLQFAFSEDNPNQPLINYLGLNHVEQAPKNSVFSINGEQHTSSTNNISINNVIEIDLLSTSDTPVTLQIMPDTDEIIHKVNDFVDSYNHLVNLAHDNMDHQHSARKLLNDISKITKKHANVLEASGLAVNEKGNIETEKALLTQSTKNGQFQELFNDISDFKADIIKTTNQLNLDPLAYIDKVIVTYPNTAKSLPNPYSPSMYSGLLFNSYA